MQYRFSVNFGTLSTLDALKAYVIYIKGNNIYSKCANVFFHKVKTI